MSLLNIITKQLIEVIEWTDDSRDTLSYRWPDEDKEIKNGAQLIVRESQQVQFVSAGQFADLFQPGKHTLSTQNIPILSTLQGWKYGFQSPFKCDVYYLNTRLFTGNKWGTANPVMMRERMVSANSSRRKFWSVPATSLRNLGASTMRKS